MLHEPFLTIAHHWPIWLVSAILVLAATIDGWKLKVPNWVTFPMIIAGWTYAGSCSGWSGLGASMAGTALGLGLLLPAYAIGGMGAGDVKLLAGVGAWIGVNDTLWAFAISALVGGLIAVVMVACRKKWKHHQQQFVAIVDEIFLVRDPARLSALAAERKSRMMLLPYGIPIAIGTIGYFVWAGMLV
jgi:prepilin peptidase CpaA